MHTNMRRHQSLVAINLNEDVAAGGLQSIAKAMASDAVWVDRP